MSFGVVAPYKNSYDISEVMNEERRSDCYGLSEENADKIMADYGSSVQKAKAKVDEYKTKADKAEELQKQLDDIEQES